MEFCGLQTYCSLHEAHGKVGPKPQQCPRKIDYGPRCRNHSMSTLTLRHLKHEHIIVYKCARKNYDEGNLGLKNADKDRGWGEGKVIITITIMVMLNCVVNP